MDQKDVKALGLYGCDHAEYNHRPNSMLIPVTRLALNDYGVNFFNKIYQWLLKSDYSIIKRTPSGGISFSRPMAERFRQWDFRSHGAFFELTIINEIGMWRIQIAPGAVIKDLNGKPLSGRKAYFMLIAILKRYNIDLESYAIKNGAEINAEIEKPLIYVTRPQIMLDKTYFNVNHIDFHNSYPAGLANTHPEFKAAIDWLYQNRKTKPQYKDILNYSIGFFHSKYLGWRFAHLAKDAINDSNKRLRSIAKKVEESGRVILLYNTDGFWYIGAPYHGPGEGDDLGQWHNDHINCQFRMKSAGAYEFIENGLYKPVLRGFTNLDEIKPRAEWVWGDIYRNEAEVKQFEFIENKGFIKVGG